MSVKLRFLPASTTGFPQFLNIQQSFRLSESIHIGYVVVRAHGATSRPGAALSYHICGGNQHDTFDIDSDSGELRVKHPLDYERTRSYNIWLSVRDDLAEPLLTDYVSLTISITDDNDCVPIFNRLYFNATVPENELQSVVVTTVTASDNDDGDNGRVSYSLVSGNVGDVFVIDSTTGRLRTQRVLDRETLDHYSLVVHATDHVSNDLFYHCIISNSLPYFYI